MPPPSAAFTIELRSHSQDLLWRTFFDGLFSFASALLAIFFGAALANVVRGVPLGPDDYFFLPLWTNWRPGPNPGILDWYTVTGGVLALLALALHGSLYLALKTEGDLEQRAFRSARRLLPAVIIVTAISLPATVLARPDSLQNYLSRPISFVAPIAVVVSLVSLFVALRKSAALTAFLSSCCYLASMLAGAAAGLFPTLLPAVGGAGQDVTIARALAGPHTLRVGVVWWSLGILMAITYFCITYWLFRGKVSQQLGDYGH
jgi:cytochrome d ubiquinol oxidase subunit II